MVYPDVSLWILDWNRNEDGDRMKKDIADIGLAIVDLVPEKDQDKVWKLLTELIDIIFDKAAKIAR